MRIHKVGTDLIWLSKKYSSGDSIPLGPEVRGSESARGGEAGGGEQGNREHRPLTGTLTSQPGFRIRIRSDFDPLDPDPGGQRDE